MADTAAFQSVIHLRSFCLNVSGAVAPSAPAFDRSLPQDSSDQCHPLVDVIRSLTSLGVNAPEVIDAVLATMRGS
jgi:hypothetical protein